MIADMAYQWRDSTLYAPKGFIILARTRDDLCAVHIGSRRTARVSGASIKMDDRPESVQRDLNYACMKLLRELERDAERKAMMCHEGGTLDK